MGGSAEGAVEGIERVRTDRLLLRRFTDDDRAPFAALNSDPVVMEHFPSTLDRAQSDAIVDRIDATWDERGWGLWAIEVVEPGDGGGATRSADGPAGPDHTPGGMAPTGFIGFAGLAPADHLAPGAVEVGWRLAHHAWGRGYAPEAATAALRVGFEHLGLDEIVSFTVPQNANSRRVMEKIGLERRPERDFDHPGVDPATSPHLVRHVLYALDRATWMARQPGG
jgi:RimJ/RimL family protein N-acetyltransferase